MKKILLKTTFSLILFFISHSVFSQEQEYIIGKLVDAKTKEPVPFASIRIKGRALGVISNTDGGFKIPTKYKTYGDTLEISSMGYERSILLIDDLSKFDDPIIKMNPGILGLDEAIVMAKKKRKRKLTARQIVRRAIKAIPENYPNAPFSTVGYYRDYQRDSSLQYVNLNEAILEVFDEGFDTVDSADTKVRIYDYLENADFKRDTFALKEYNYKVEGGRKVIDQAFLSSYGGNEFTILRVHDALRNHQINSYSFVYRLKSDILSQHKFSREKDTYFNGESLYSIRFKKLLLNYSAYGTVYISKKNFAIHKIHYTVYDRNKRRTDGDVNEHGNNNKLIFEITTEYSWHGDKMYLNYISFQNTFRLWDPPKLVTEYIRAEPILGRFVIGFNSKVILEEAVSLENYEIKVKGRIIPLKKAVLLDTQDVVHLIPKMYPNKAEQMLREIDVAGRKNRVSKELFEIKFKNIRDMEGNVINEWTSRDYYQFREYFVQEVKPKVVRPLDTLYMIKEKPIFKDQPITKPDNFDDYWMNTPLQNIEN